MHKIPFDVLVHSENALILAKEMDALLLKLIDVPGNDSNLLIVFYVQIMPDDLVMQLHRF